MKKLLLLLCFITLSINIAYCSEANFVRAISSWQGENINDVINIWGYPTNEKTIAGRHLYLWESERIRKYDTSYYGHSYGSATSYEVYCDKIAEVDLKNTIINVSYNGYCSLGTSQAKAMANPKNNYWLELEKLHKQAILEKEAQKKLKVQAKLEKKAQKEKIKQQKKQEKQENKKTKE